MNGNKSYIYFYYHKLIKKQLTLTYIFQAKLSRDKLDTSTLV